MNASNEKMTSSGVTGLPSCQRALARKPIGNRGKIVRMAAASASNPYSVDTSSSADVISVSMNSSVPLAMLPFTPDTTLLKLSKVPNAICRTTPPCGAAGLT